MGLINYNTARRIAQIGGGSAILGAGYSAANNRNSTVAAASSTGFVIGGGLGAGGTLAAYAGGVRYTQWNRENKRLYRNIIRAGEKNFKAGVKPSLSNEVNKLRTARTFRPTVLGLNSQSPSFIGLGEYRGRHGVYLDNTPYLGQENLKIPHAMAVMDANPKVNMKKGIFVNPHFLTLEKKYQDTILAHEAQHIEGDHINRFFIKDPITGNKVRTLSGLWKSETDADQGAKRAGLGNEMGDYLRAILGSKNFETPWYNKLILAGRAAKLGRF